MKIDDDFLAKYVGNKIKTYRKEIKMTQGQLGEHLNVKNNSISAYERGVVLPNLEQLKKIALILNKSLDDFFPEENYFYSIIKETENNFTPNETDTLKIIIEETFKIDESKREDFLDKLSTLVKLYQ